MKHVTAVAVAKRRLLRRSAQQWRALIEAQEHSGLSIAAPCRAHRLCIGTMTIWRKRLRAEDSRLGHVAAHAQSGG